jgi:hypothetical protein
MCKRIMMQERGRNKAPVHTNEDVRARCTCAYLFLQRVVGSRKQGCAVECLLMRRMPGQEGCRKQERKGRTVSKSNRVQLSNR